MAGCLRKGFDYIEHRIAAASAQVVCYETIFRSLHAGNGVQVALGQIDDVNVITNAGAIVGIVVTTEYTDKRTAANRCLCNVRHQVVWLAIWILADKTAWMGAHWIEVSQ